jgi:hypothetical protein
MAEVELRIIGVDAGVLLIAVLVRLQQMQAPLGRYLLLLLSY